MQMPTPVKSRCWLWLLFVLGSISQGTAQDFRLTTSADPLEARWVDSIFNEMTPEERIGQLFMIRAHSDLGEDHIRQVEELIETYQVGGLCFFQGTPEKQLELTNAYQQLTSHVPLMIAIDAEWGLGMRMRESVMSFPRQLMLGAIQNNRLLYEMGEEIARQLRRVGTTVNFAPVADVNNNPENPVINTRSFGEDRYNVTVKSYMYMKGMQDHGVMACAKHFPGHGDTDVDSHHDLPVIPFDRYRLDSIELYPFRALADYGIGSMMIAHLNVPVLDDRDNRPTTLSENTVTNLLKRNMGFKGLIFTDALEMKGVTKHYESGEVEAEALLAGNDILVLPEDLEAAMSEIRNYLEAGQLLQADLDARVKKVLRAKYRLGLKTYEPQPVEGIRKDINRPEAMTLKRRLIREALTLVRNEKGLIPFAELDSMQMASLSIGASSKTPFQQRLDAYADFTHLQTDKNISQKEQAALLGQLESYDAVLVSLHDMSSYASREYGVTESTRDFIYELSRRTEVILTVFGTPYALRYFDDVDHVLEAYDEDPVTQDLAAQALFGVFAIRGRLPVTASLRSSFNTGITTQPTFRLGFTFPEEVDLNSDTLRRIEELAQRAVELKATPGCVVLVAKNGQVVYEKAFGHHTYRRERSVRVDDVYDLASLTKILASTLAVMKLKEEGALDLDAPIARYLPELDSTNKAELSLRSIMAHHAGLISWIPFYQQTLTGSRRYPKPSSAFYRRSPGDAYEVPVTSQLFLRRDMVDTIWQQIANSELRNGRGYRYSDLGFYLIAKVIESVSGQPLDQYAAAHFYRPLGLRTATFRPWQHLSLEQVPPTEEDRYFRRQRVHGYVHDMGAAMLGGVSGHAGLFASAREVAVLMQMLLQEGYYGGRRYLDAATVREFLTRYPGSSRRAIGFDMFQLDAHYGPNLSPLASKESFGHTGFTGTCTWADPENEVVYVFLSNRTYPSMKNYKLNRMDVRDRIQTMVYEAVSPREESEEHLALPLMPEADPLPRRAPAEQIVSRSRD